MNSLFNESNRGACQHTEDDIVHRRLSRRRHSIVITSIFGIICFVVWYHFHHKLLKCVHSWCYLVGTQHRPQHFVGRSDAPPSGHPCIFCVYICVCVCVLYDGCYSLNCLSRYHVDAIFNFKIIFNKNFENISLMMVSRKTKRWLG